MSKQIFDQDRPRSTMAQRLDEAFAGCDEWTVISAPRRRSTLDFTPTAASSPQVFDGAALSLPDETKVL
jgi:L-rhamnose isomerase